MLVRIVHSIVGRVIAPTSVDGGPKGICRVDDPTYLIRPHRFKRDCVLVIRWVDTGRAIHLGYPRAGWNGQPNGLCNLYARILTTGLGSTGEPISTPQFSRQTWCPDGRFRRLVDARDVPQHH